MILIIEKSGHMEIQENYVMDNIKKSYKESFVVSLLLAILAIVLLLNTESFIGIVIQVFGYVAIFLGILSIVHYFNLDKQNQLLSKNLQNGIILCVSGCIAFMQTDIIKEMITFLIGGYLIVRNATRTQMAMTLKQENTNIWVWLLAMSLFNVFVGFFIIIHPLDSLLPINTFLGIAILIAEGIVVIENCLVLISFKKKRGKKHEQQ